MDLSNGKHITKEIDGALCSIADDTASKSRCDFLKSLLEFNKLEVKIMENPEKEGQEQTFTIGVTDLLFNPVIAVYEKHLFNKYGRVVTPNYWNQAGENENIPYWTEGREIQDLYNQELNK